jgi:hypothetical protein
VGRVTKIVLQYTQLGLTIINCLIAIFQYSTNRICTGPSCVKCCWFLRFNFSNNRAKADGCHLHTLFYSLYPLLPQLFFATTLCWCPWTTDRSAPVEAGRSNGEIEWRMSWLGIMVLCICFPWILCIKEFSESGICSSNFRAAWEKTAALLMCWRWVRCVALRQALRVCVVRFQGGISVCPHIILSATLFQLLCIPLRVLRVALLLCTTHPFLS